MRHRLLCLSAEEQRPPDRHDDRPQRRDREDDPEDRDVEAWVRSDVRWFVKDADGRWVKNGHSNDVDAVIARCREEQIVLRAQLGRAVRVENAPSAFGASMEEERTA